MGPALSPGQAVWSTWTGRLPVTGHHALVAGTLTWEHRDPVDRTIVAQAMIESIPVVTGDRALAGFPGIHVVW